MTAARIELHSSGPLARFRAKWVPARVKKSVRNALEPPVPIQSERGALVSGFRRLCATRCYCFCPAERSSSFPAGAGGLAAAPVVWPGSVLAFGVTGRAFLGEVRFHAQPERAVARPAGSVPSGQVAAWLRPR